jgi:hypothetical protein
MQTLDTWENYESNASNLAILQRVKDFSTYVLLEAVVQPGLIPWSERDTKIQEVYDSTRKIESAFRTSFPGLEIIAIESPKGHNPNRETERYSASFAAKDSEGLCAGINLEFRYNPNHERYEGRNMERFPQVPFDMIGALSLGSYQQKTRIS